MTRLIPAIDTLPLALYRAHQVRHLDQVAIEQFGVPGIELMERAGQALLDRLRRAWPHARRILILCGTGNNGGDGYVLARLAREAGYKVRVIQLGDPDSIKGDARTNVERLPAVPRPFESELPPDVDVIVDALLGTGLERPVEGKWAQVIECINRHSARVIAVDIPSGLSSDTGVSLGGAVRADVTVSFIGLKQGLFTGDGPDHCGAIEFDALSVPAAIYASEILSCRRIAAAKVAPLLPPRRRTAHKGAFGHILVIGGEHGYAGAARLAAEAAARSGAGLVSVATRPGHVGMVGAARPELMVHGIASGADLTPLLARATVVVIGPGMGQGDWARSLLARVLDSDLPTVLDADALNLLAGEPVALPRCILTPHPGEAARLLDCDIDTVQADRFAAARQLHERYGGVVVLKGAGTLICDQRGRLSLSSTGNPGMASGGMGDVLSGIVGALVGQGLELSEAACAGAWLHGAAADCAVNDGERGLLASDLMPHIRRLANFPEKVK